MGALNKKGMMNYMNNNRLLFLFLALVGLADGGCMMTGKNLTHACNPKTAGLSGCTNNNNNIVVDNKKVGQAKQESQQNMKQIAWVADHTETVNGLKNTQNFCPMNFDNFGQKFQAEPIQTQLIHANQAARASLMLAHAAASRAEFNKSLRQMYYNCHALAVFHHGTKEYYAPLAVLKDYFP